VLRIRPSNGTIIELKILKEILEVLHKIVSSPQTTDDIKKIMIKKFAQVSPCCTCGGITSLEVVYTISRTGIVSIIWQLLDTISKQGHYVFIS
jgi:hypothetical protein